MFRDLTPPPYQNNDGAWFTPSHIVVVVGFDDTNVYIDDPLRTAPGYAVPTAIFATAASTAPGTGPDNWYAASIAR